MLAGPLLVLILVDNILIVTVRHVCRLNCDSLQSRVLLHALAVLLRGHMEDWRSLGWVLDDVVVDVVIVYDVGHVPTLRTDLFLLSSLLTTLPSRSGS